jgi:hypothetical protein
MVDETAPLFPVLNWVPHLLQKTESEGFAVLQPGQFLFLFFIGLLRHHEEHSDVVIPGLPRPFCSRNDSLIKIGTGFPAV